MMKSNYFVIFSVIIYYIDPIIMMDMIFKMHGLSLNLNIALIFENDFSCKCFT